MLNIFSRIKREGGWRIQFVIDELHEKWGWLQNDTDVSSQGTYYAQSNGSASLPPMQPPAAQQPKHKLPSGIVNPLYRHANFSNPNAPYKDFWVPPNLPTLPAPLPPPPQQHASMHTGGAFGFSGMGGYEKLS